MTHKQMKALKPGDVVWHQPNYVTAGTPHKLVAVSPGNGQAGCDWWLFRHAHDEHGGFVGHHNYSMVEQDRATAIEMAAQRLEAQANRIRQGKFG